MSDVGRARGQDKDTVSQAKGFFEVMGYGNYGKMFFLPVLQQILHDFQFHREI